VDTFYPYSPLIGNQVNIKYPSSFLGNEKGNYQKSPSQTGLVKKVVDNRGPGPQIALPFLLASMVVQVTSL
jgi:hypothetical protein